MRPEEAKKGVGLVLLCHSHVLLGEECENKRYLGKLKGMYSFPMETVEDDESDLDCLNRLIQEELSGLERHIPNPQLMGRYQIVQGVWLSTFQATCTDFYLPDPEKVRGDVKNHYWTPLAAAVEHQNLRAGAWEPLQDCLAGKKGVTRRKCRWPNMVQALPAAS